MSDLIVGCEIDGVSETASCDAHTTKNGMHPDLLYTQSQHCWTAATGHQASGERDWSTFEHAFAKDALLTNSEKPVAFLVELVHLLLEYLRKSGDRTCKVLDFHQPHSLREIMGHCLDLHAEPQDLEQILSDCKETLKYCVKTGHPHFVNQLSTGLDVISVAGEWLTAVTNTNMFTYEIAPVFTLMENVVLTRMCSLVGWPMGVGDGVFAPGGAISNLYAVLAARHAVLPAVKRKGLQEMPRLVMFESDQSHYSIKRAAIIMGIGLDNVISVKSDSRGKVIASELDAKLTEVKARGYLPFFVSTTAGTTVLGAFDPLEDVADVCQRHEVWLHVDACYGGSVLLSKKHCHLTRGIHRSCQLQNEVLSRCFSENVVVAGPNEDANSVSWNPHKLMGITLQCSAILIREKGLLEACNALKASYLFQPDKQYDVSYDTGDKTIQCGRHNDIFKLWLMWRAYGDRGFEMRIDRLMQLSSYLYAALQKTEGFELVLHNATSKIDGKPSGRLSNFVLVQPEFLNVCFWFIPPCLRHVTPGTERNKQLHKVAPQIKAMMMEKGSLMIGYQPLGDLPNFFRAVISNAALMECDIDFMLDEIARLGSNLVL